MVARVVFGFLTVGFVGLQSCTAVLGMERATLDLSADGSAGGSGNVPNTLPKKTNRCTEPPTTTCTACLTRNCGADYEGCLNDHDCRVKLREYAFCLGDTCQVNSLEDCANENLDPGLADCAATCQTECRGTMLASPCAHYCGCMPVCAAGIYAQQHPEAPALTGADCLKTCEEQFTPVMADCLRSHCEFADASSAADDVLMHCEHATGIARVCANAAPPDPRRLCLALYESGWACDSLSQCCSKRCNSHVCD
jgi:hypothetical protein